MSQLTPKKLYWGALIAAPLLALTACGSSSGDSGDSGDTKLTLAHSYADDQPQAKCGADVIKKGVADADVGLDIEIFGNSQLGGDSDRIASVASGDIDIDIQGASALGAIYEPISVLDAAYVFDDAEHLGRFMDSDKGQKVMDDFASETGVHVLGAWSAGSRQFTSNSPVRTPDDLKGKRIRFPGSPQYLMNAKALGADATEVAYEELYLALQQGTVDGQENPITNIKALNLNEVQSDLSMTSHQLNTNLVITGPAYEELNDEQKKALDDSVEDAVGQETKCVADDEESTLQEWKDSKAFTIHEDVDREAFKKKALDYLKAELKDDSLATFTAIRETSE